TARADAAVLAAEAAGARRRLEAGAAARRRHLCCLAHPGQAGAGGTETRPEGHGPDPQRGNGRGRPAAARGRRGCPEKRERGRPMKDFLIGEQLRFYLSAGGVLGWTRVVALVIALQLLLTL